MLIRTPLSGKPGAFWDMFFGGGVETCIEGGLLKLNIRCGLSERAYRRIQETVRAAQADDNIKAIFMDVDSGGGDASECFETAAVVNASMKPTVTYVAGYSASAMYAITAATNRIFAHPSAFVGSVGVLNMLPKVGEYGTIVTSTKSPNKVNLGDDPEGIARERTLLDATYDQFVAGLSAHRGVPVEKIEAEWGKGGLLTAAQALAVGMIDEVGDREKALTFAMTFTAATPPAEDSPETESEEAETETEGGESAGEGPQMALKDWFATRKAKAEMTPEEVKAAEEISPEWLKENKPEVFDAIYNAGKESAATEAAAAKDEETKLVALADESNTDEQTVVAELKTGKLKAADFMRRLLEVRKAPSEMELKRRAAAKLAGDSVALHYGAETGAPRAGDNKALAADIVSRLKKSRKAGN